MLSSLVIENQKDVKCFWKLMEHENQTYGWNYISESDM